MDNYVWLFAPGTTSYLPQLARYCDTVSFDEDGQSKPIKKNICQKMIGNKYFCVKFPEIDMDMQKNSKVVDTLAKTFSKVKHYVMDTNANGLHYFPAFNRFNLGQEADMASIQKTYLDMMVTLDPKESIILFGVSRGAMALINWFAKYQPTRIKALILEGTPSDLNDIVENSKGINYYYYSAVKKVLPLISSFKPDGPTATRSIFSLPRNLPILLITSKADTVVPYECSLNLKNLMDISNFTSTKLCILDHSSHNGYLSEHGDDIDTYVTAVREFYEMIGKRSESDTVTYDKRSESDTVTYDKRSESDTVTYDQ